MDAVVVADGLEKRYGDTVALGGVSLAVEPGEVFGLIGPNGAGKTTLVRALTGTTVPDVGSASILGSEPTAVDRDRLGVLPQRFSPPERLTAAELIDYYAGLYGDAREPGEVIADVGVAGAADTRYEDLSGGQKRRVCVGTALVNDPDVLFLDEPTTGIDPAGRRTVWRLIEALAEGGTTVFLTTHDMAEAERLADRVGLLADGKLVAAGTPGELIAEHGGPNRLTVETDAEPGRLEGVSYPVEGRDGGLVVEGVEPAEIGDVVATLEKREVPYTGLTWTEPDLEDVYLELADGAERLRTLRGGGPPPGGEDAVEPTADGGETTPDGEETTPDGEGTVEPTADGGER